MEGTWCSRKEQTGGRADVQCVQTASVVSPYVPNGHQLTLPSKENPESGCLYKPHFIRREAKHVRLSSLLVRQNRDVIHTFSSGHQTPELPPIPAPPTSHSCPAGRAPAPDEGQRQPPPEPPWGTSLMPPSVPWTLTASESLGLLWPHCVAWAGRPGPGAAVAGPDLWLCYYCVLEFLQPRAPWRTPVLSLGRISQTAEETSKMLGTSCVTVSPRPPGTGGLLFAARGRRKLIKGRGWGGAAGTSVPWLVLPYDNVPSFLTKTVITLGPLMCSQRSRRSEPS